MIHHSGEMGFIDTVYTFTQYPIIRQILSTLPFLTILSLQTHHKFREADVSFSAGPAWPSKDSWVTSLNTKMLTVSAPKSFSCTIKDFRISVEVTVFIFGIFPSKQQFSLSMNSLK